eukprot:2628233-Ditylum_brightwellii.AAC.1
MASNSITMYSILYQTQQQTKISQDTRHQKIHSLITISNFAPRLPQDNHKEKTKNMIPSRNNPTNHH